MDNKSLKSGDFTFSVFFLRVILICFSSTGCTSSVMFMQIFRIRTTRQNFRQALQHTWVLHLPYPTHCFSFWTHYSATSKLMLNTAYMFSAVVQNYLMEQHVFFSFRISLQIRMTGSLSFIFVLFVLTTVLVKVDTDSCKYMIMLAISYVLFSFEKTSEF